MPKLSLVVLLAAAKNIWDFHNNITTIQKFKRDSKLLPGYSYLNIDNHCYEPIHNQMEFHTSEIPLEFSLQLQLHITDYTIWYWKVLTNITSNITMEIWSVRENINFLVGRHFTGNLKWKASSGTCKLGYSNDDVSRGEEKSL